LKCPYCLESETKVIDSRESDESTRRRRECLECGKRFTTYENVEFAPLYVIKKNGAKELFECEKIKKGVLRACEKRPVSAEQIELMLDKIESKLRAMHSTEIPSKAVGEQVIKHLKKIDKVAYIRFASVYKEFADVSCFHEEIKNL